MSIPLIFRHPGRIPPQQRADLLVSNYDLLPTVLSYLGLESNIPPSPERPGRNFAEVLKGQSIPWDNTVFYEFENVRAIRTEEWKYIERIHQQPNELYNLVKDPGERDNLHGRPEFQQIQQQLQTRLKEFFDRYPDPKWDLWKGGRSKTDLMTAQFFGIDNPYRESDYEPAPGEGIRK